MLGRPASPSGPESRIYGSDWRPFDSAFIRLSPIQFKVCTYDRLTEERPFGSIYPGPGKLRSEYTDWSTRTFLSPIEITHSTPSYLSIEGSSPSKATNDVELSAHVSFLPPDAYKTKPKRTSPNLFLPSIHLFNDSPWPSSRPSQRLLACRISSKISPLFPNFAVWITG